MKYTKPESLVVWGAVAAIQGVDKGASLFLELYLLPLVFGLTLAAYGADEV